MKEKTYYKAKAITTIDNKIEDGSHELAKYSEKEFIKLISKLKKIKDSYYNFIKAEMFK